MRIGVNTLFMIPGDVGGTEVYLRNTLTAMAAQDTENVLVLFTNRENDSLLRRDLAEYPTVEYYQLPCRASVRPIRILIEQVLLPFVAKRQDVDVLWSPGYTAPAFCFSPQAVTIHDLQYKSHPEDMKFSERLILDALVRIACRRCEAVITISSFSKEEILRYSFAKEKKIHAIPEGVNEHFAVNLQGNEKEKKVKLARLGVQQPYLLCVAHTYPHKNVDQLVEAFSLFADTFPYQLVLVGKARRGEDKVIESLKKIENPDKVVRFSRLSETELILLYQCADIFILPSAYEGFGLPVLEAMMAGVPVITSRMASLPELGGDYVLYVDTPTHSNLFQALSDLISLPKKEIQQLVSGAQKRARSFTWERAALQTVKALESITHVRQ